MLLIVLLAQSWGLLFGGTFMDPKSAQTITTVVRACHMVVVHGFVARWHVLCLYRKYPTANTVP